jgi:proteasome assembly chaperone (PAC2) family protein
MLKVYSEPELRSPVLLCGFGGWADAASSATGALRYLLLKRAGRRIAEYSPDAIYTYTMTRPLTLIEESGSRRLQWPDLSWTALEVPEAQRDLLILVGPEPDLRWRELVTSILEFAHRLGVSQVLTFGAFLAQVHYAGPVPMIGLSSDPQMRARMLQMGIAESNYQGPTGFVTAVLREAADRGVPSASLWVAAPSYLSSTSNPKLAASLLRAAERLLGQSLWREELETAGRDMEKRIEEALRARPDLATFLGKLSGEPAAEEPPDPVEVEEPAAELPVPEAELPSAEEVLRDLEEHLRRLKGEGNGTSEEEGPDRP